MYITERNKEQNKSRSFPPVNTVFPLWCGGAQGRGQGALAVPGPSIPGVMVAQTTREGGRKMAPFASSQAVFGLGTTAGGTQKLRRAGRSDRSAELQRSNIPGQAPALRSTPDRSPQSSPRKGARREGGKEPPPAKSRAGQVTFQAVCAAS